MPEIFIYFGLGVLFIEALPVLEAFITLIVQFLSMLQGYVAVNVTKQSAKIADIKENAMQSKSSMRAIGFGVSYDDDDEEDESEDY